MPGCSIRMARAEGRSSGIETGRIALVRRPRAGVSWPRDRTLACSKRFRCRGASWPCSSPGFSPARGAPPRRPSRRPALTATGLAASRQPTPGAAGAPTPAPAAARPVDITATTYRPEPVGHSGGTLTIGTWGTPPSMSQLQGLWVERPLALLSLWEVTPDDRYVPRLATQVPTLDNGGVVLRPDGGMDVTIDLIPGARWSDGQPITCEDLDYQALLTGGSPIQDVDGGSGPRCVAHFVRPSLDYLLIWFPLLPAHYVKGREIAELYPTTDVASGVYSGPYMPARLAEGKEIHFVPNPQFWATIGKTEPPFDSVVISYYRSSDAEIAAFADGELDVALDLMSPDLPKVASFPPGQVDAIDAGVSMSTIWNRAALVDSLGRGRRRRHPRGAPLRVRQAGDRRPRPGGRRRPRLQPRLGAPLVPRRHRLLLRVRPGEGRRDPGRRRLRPGSRRCPRQGRQAAHVPRLHRGGSGNARTGPDRRSHAPREAARPGGHQAGATVGFRAPVGVGRPGRG